MAYQDSSRRTFQNTLVGAAEGALVGSFFGRAGTGAGIGALVGASGAGRNLGLPFFQGGKSLKRKSKSRKSSKSPKRKSSKVNFKITLTNKKPSGKGWKSDGCEYNSKTKQYEYFWYR